MINPAQRSKVRILLLTLRKTNEIHRLHPYRTYVASGVVAVVSIVPYSAISLNCHRIATDSQFKAFILYTRICWCSARVSRFYVWYIRYMVCPFSQFHTDLDT